MIADVRLKVKMRLEARMAELLEKARKSVVLTRGAEWRKEHPRVCMIVRGYYMDQLERVVPGAIVDPYLYTLYVYLPNGYPKQDTPILVRIPREVLRAMNFGEKERQ